MAAVVSCKPAITPEEPEVPTIAFTNTDARQNIPAAGGEFTVTIEANCDWTLTGSDSWITPAKTAGNGNDVVNVTVAQTKLGRNGSLTLECKEVPGRTAVISITQEGGKEITSVGATAASDLLSSDGATATLASTFEAYGIQDSDNVQAGFTITGGAEPIEVTGVVNISESKISGSATGLVPDTEYTVKAWMTLNGGSKITGSESTFKTEKEVVAEPVTIVGDFTSNDLWNLATDITAATADEVKVTDSNGYTWTISGGAINGECLWLGTTAKVSFDGYVILPQLTGKKVTSISFPNDGPSPSGKARITISRSTDNGASFTDLEGLVDVECGEYELTDQPAGAIYKITNVKISKGGYSKTTKITIKAE